MHLKNWSLLSRSGRVALSPAYDLLNTSIILKNPQEETALSIRGRKRNLNRSDLLDYLAVERCGLPPDLMQYPKVAHIVPFDLQRLCDNVHSNQDHIHAREWRSSDYSPTGL